MSIKANKLRHKFNKTHKVLNRNPNFPCFYYCVGNKYANAFVQQGGYDYNAEVASYTDDYGANVSMQIEADYHHQDDLMDKGVIPYTLMTFSEIQMTAKLKNRPEGTDLFFFESKNAPYSFAMRDHKLYSELNLIDNQDSTVSAYIRACDIDEAQQFFSKLKNIQVTYQAEPGTWKTSIPDGFNVSLDK